MTPQEILTIRNHMTLIGRTRSQIPFLYIPKDEDGIPLLRTDPEEIDAMTYLEVIQTASDPRAVRGRIQKKENGLFVFVVQAGVDPSYIANFLRDLKEGMAGQLPTLSYAMLDTEDD